VTDTTAFGRNDTSVALESAAKAEIFTSLCRLSKWLDDNNLSAYDPFDGLNASLVRLFTCHNKFLETALQQGVRRFPLNPRPLLGVRKSQSTKGMGFLARAYIRLHQATGDPAWADKARAALDWLMEHRSPGYSGACWGNHFDYRCRSFYLPKGVPTVVWTALIGHAFIDGYYHFKDNAYLEVASSACKHIQRDLDAFPVGHGLCISYVPGLNCQVHNANVLGASLLARVYPLVNDGSYLDLARKAMTYTVTHQLPDGAWYYGEKENLRWVDNFHTAYVLDCLKHYTEATSDRTFGSAMAKGYRYWTDTFFLADGTPRYYRHKTLPIDIQCSSQAIDTLVFFGDLDLALKVARWTIRNMQDPSGYFYYRRYAPWLVNKTPTLHWGQATMLCALGGLYRAL
jgi:hypothetical protein